MRQLLARLTAQEAGVIVGLMLLGIGAALVYPPAGLILVGAIMLVLALWRM